MVRPSLLAAAALIAGALLYPVAFQVTDTVRFDLGSMDWDYLMNEEQVYDRVRMQGPTRLPDGSVEVIEFYGRLTAREVGFRLPYHGVASPLRLRLRCHRFGLEGTVHLRVNGEPLDSFVFTDRSYPWGRLQVVVPQDVAERGPLTIELETEGGKPSPSHLPEALGIGIDWIEVEPLSRGVELRVPWTTVALALLFPLAGALFTRSTGASLPLAVLVLAALLVLVLVVTTLTPFTTAMALRRLWVVFPLGFLLHRGLRRAFIGRWRPELAPQEITYVSHVFVIACLAHSVLIFFPNHAPPDLWNHLPQVEWLSELPLDFDSIYRYSTSSDPFDDGHVRPHFGVEYGAPYPPFFYVLTLAATKLHGDARFLIEFLSVLVIAAMTVPLFLLARTVFHDPRIAQLAVLLFVLEISAWHHAHRVHGPGTMGALLVLVWMVYLTAYHDSLYERAHLWIFAVLSATAALSYAASLVQLCILAAVLLLLLWIGGPRSLTKRVVLGFGMGLLASFVFYYAPYALEAIRKSSLLLDRATYEPPATFFFLRNQMRDTVRILYNGYPLFVALSIGGWVLLCRAEVAGFHRRFLVAWGLTYGLMLILKDPALFPMIFLHAKEDLFYASLACLLGGLFLTYLWARPPWGRVMVVGVFLGAALLAIRDQHLNRNTLHDQRVTRARDGATQLAMGHWESDAGDEATGGREVRKSQQRSTRY